MKIGIIDYGAGNLMSVANALEKLGQSYEIFSDVQRINDFDKLILPGVGAAAPAMSKLQSLDFAELLPKLHIPVLGICLGLQLFADFSFEGNTDCLGIIPGKVRRFNFDLKIPQIGWNKVDFVSDSPLVEGIPNNSYFYFVNSFYLDVDDFVVGRTPYGTWFPSIVSKENFYAVQFHPEKSGELGIRLLRNFCEKC